MPEDTPKSVAPDTMARRLAIAQETAVRAEIGSLAKSDFLSRLSHDLRSPMNGVMGMLRLLQDSGLEPHQRDYAAAAAKSAERLLALVREISAFPLQDARAIHLAPAPFPLAETCRAVVKFLAGRAAEKKLALRCEVAEGVPPVVHGDAEKLAQVLANLLDNAIRFTREGAVRLEARPASDGPPEIEFIVADTGSGISPAKQAVIFDFSDPLVADGPHADISLELAVCREIVAAMGGRIGLASTPGKGTVFTVTVPLPAAEIPATEDEDETDIPVAASPSSPLAQTYTSLRVLVAEDDPINQSLAVAFIEKLGGQVDIADNGRIALDKCRHQHYDLVFMDCEMPEMDGFDAARALRDHEQETGATRRLPIIAMTAYAMPGDRERCLAAGMDDHVPKPVTIDVLQAVVGRHLLPDRIASPDKA
jgi:CheY-like chemotaxis protein